MCFCIHVLEKLYFGICYDLYGNPASSLANTQIVSSGSLYRHRYCIVIIKRALLALCSIAPIEWGNLWFSDIPYIVAGNLCRRPGRG